MVANILCKNKTLSKLSPIFLKSLKIAFLIILLSVYHIVIIIILTIFCILVNIECEDAYIFDIALTCLGMFYILFPKIEVPNYNFIKLQYYSFYFLICVIFMNAKSLIIHIYDGDINMDINVFLLTCILTPISEEFLCRGLLLRKLRQITTLEIAIILQAVVFTLLHTDVLKFPIYFCGGIALGILSLRSMWLVILLHFLINILVWPYKTY